MKPMIDSRFSILTFPQRFDGANLHLRILLVPKLSTAWNGNPLLPVLADVPNPGDTATPFADADLQFEVRVLDGLERFPVNAPVDFTRSLPAASGVAGDARALFEELVAPGPGRFRLSNDPPRLAEPVKTEIFIKKYLPRSYRESFLFTGPRTRDAVTDDSYHCAIKARKDPNPAFVTTPDTVSWGQVYAYCLRHHLLAERLGLVREASFPVEGELLANGGFLYVDLASGSTYAAEAAADFTFLKRYAARIPQLAAGVERPLFAAVQFPILFDDPLIPGPPGGAGQLRRGVHRGGRLRRRLRQDRARHAAGQPEPAGGRPGRLHAPHRRRHPPGLGRRADPHLAEPPAQGRPDSPARPRQAAASRRARWEPSDIASTRA